MGYTVYTAKNVYVTGVINDCSFLSLTLRVKEGKKNSVLMEWHTPLPTELEIRNFCRSRCVISSWTFSSGCSPFPQWKWEFETFAELGVSHQAEHFSFWWYATYPTEMVIWYFCRSRCVIWNYAFFILLHTPSPSPQKWEFEIFADLGVSCQAEHFSF